VNILTIATYFINSFNVDNRVKAIKLDQKYKVDG